MAGGVWIAKRRPLVNQATLPDGYAGDSTALGQEYDHYYGNRTEIEKTIDKFESATELAAKRNFPAVASVLESIAKIGGVPVIYHDLGVSYAMLGDLTRAADAFREALAREPEYGPTRKYLRELKAMGPGAADPYTREVEPNADSQHATLIALRTPVGGEITGNSDTADYFRVIAPPAPRDLMTVELANHSSTFAAKLRVYNSVVKSESWGEKAGKPGDSLKVVGGPQPNAPLYVAVSSENGASGLYLLTVTPLKAFDRYEPNDDIVNSRRITIGEEVSANIMDSADLDFFSFVSPRKGTVTVELRNRSSALIPVMATYNSDRRNLGYAPDVQKPGGNLHHTFEVEKDQIYYLQIASQGGTAGAYILRVD